MVMGFAPTWLRQVSPPPLLHMTTVTTACSKTVETSPLVNLAHQFSAPGLTRVLAGMKVRAQSMGGGGRGPWVTVSVSFGTLSFSFVNWTASSHSPVGFRSTITIWVTEWGQLLWAS